MAKTTKLSDHEYIEKTCCLTQSIINVMVLETHGTPTSVAVFATVLGQVMAIVSKAVVEQSGGDINEFIMDIVKTTKAVMNEPGVIEDYMRDAMRAYEGYRAIMEQAMETKGSLH